MQDRPEVALAAATPTSSVGDVLHVHHRHGPNPVAIAWRAALVLGALWLFVIALQLIKNGAGGLKPVLDAFAVNGVLGHLGFGWIGAYLVMSGSPVAAVSLSLFSGGIQNDLETFAMINGSRLGASLIVLVVGFVSYVTGRRNPDGLYIGVVALLVAITLWMPVVPLGVLILDRGWLDGVHIESPGVLTSAVGYISDPVVKPLVDAIPEGLLFVLGIGTLIGAFTIFDRALPQLEAPGERIESLSKTLQHRYAMFLFGTLVTLVTLSVSLSVTILVPLALKGYVQRDRVIPYVMGANIATWIDTLFAALLLNSPQAFTIVLTEMITGAMVSLSILFFFYGPYNRLILGAAHKVSSSRGHMIAFLACLLAAPLILIAIGAVHSMV
jgi:solute carrier family 34 (sodium-dependent phosphate cotransporter)